VPGYGEERDPWPSATVDLPSCSRGTLARRPSRDSCCPTGAARDSRVAVEIVIASPPLKKSLSVVRDGWMSGGAEVTGQARLAGEFRPLGSLGSATDGARVLPEAEARALARCHRSSNHRHRTAYATHRRPPPPGRWSRLSFVEPERDSEVRAERRWAWPDPSGPQPVFRRCHPYSRAHLRETEARRHEREANEAATEKAPAQGSRTVEVGDEQTGVRRPSATPPLG
jgi:hypothetical protein